MLRLLNLHIPCVVIAYLPSEFAYVCDLCAAFLISLNFHHCSPYCIHAFSGRMPYDKYTFLPICTVEARTRKIALITRQICLSNILTEATQDCIKNRKSSWIINSRVHFIAQITRKPSWNSTNLHSLENIKRPNSCQVIMHAEIPYNSVTL